MGLSNPEYCHPDNLEDLKAEIPHLAAKGDGFLLRMKISTLIKMESNYIKRASQDKGRSIEETLAKNQDAVAASPIPVAAGFDDRNGSLHPARFLPGPICSAQELWLQSLVHRKYLFRLWTAVVDMRVMRGHREAAFVIQHFFRRRRAKKKQQEEV